MTGHRLAVCALILPLGACSQRASGGTRASLNESLRAEILAMGESDQAAVRAAYGEPGAAKPAENFLDRAHRLRALIQQHGWPTASLVGEDGARAAWVVVQHADDDVPFQRQSLTSMESAAAAGEADRRLVACLTDRVRVNSGQPQLFGTQGNGGARSPEDKVAIDARRRSLGLPTLDEYRARFAQAGAQTLCRP